MRVLGFRWGLDVYFVFIYIYSVVFFSCIFFVSVGGGGGGGRRLIMIFSCCEGFWVFRA